MVTARDVHGPSGVVAGGGSESVSARVLGCLPGEGNLANPVVGPRRHPVGAGTDRCEDAAQRGTFVLPQVELPLRIESFVEPHRWRSHLDVAHDVDFAFAHGEPEQVQPQQHQA
jgi:hypothetical protein